MEALFKFTQVDPNRNVFDLMVRLESTATPTWFRERYLTKTDYTKLYQDSVSTMAESCSDPPCHYSSAGVVFLDFCNNIAGVSDAVIHLVNTALQELFPLIYMMMLQT